ncbi:hypothetical protein FKW77_008316 [Venturia effusa]|uniref:Uncharacterized protein n=1 Tax=Venturia effusa TaxID=50376 RepID=A0A517LKN8_9PEZI|nr:hypothetical protein FKW77_008316 [Venturia effusa]
MSNQYESLFLADAPKIALPESPPQEIPSPETPPQNIALPETPAEEVALPGSTSAAPCAFSRDPSAQHTLEEDEFSADRIAQLLPHDRQQPVTPGRPAKGSQRGRLFSVSPETASKLKSIKAENPFTTAEMNGGVRRRTNTPFSQSMQTSRGGSAFASATETPLLESPDSPRWKGQSGLPSSVRKASYTNAYFPTFVSKRNRGASTAFTSAIDIPLPASPASPEPTPLPKDLRERRTPLFEVSAQDPDSKRTPQKHMSALLKKFKSRSRAATSSRALVGSSPTIPAANRTDAHMQALLKEYRSSREVAPPSNTSSSALSTPPSSEEEIFRRRRSRNIDTARDFSADYPQAQDTTLRQGPIIRVPIVNLENEVIVLNLPRSMAVLILMIVALLGSLRHFVAVDIVIRLVTNNTTTKFPSVLNKDLQPVSAKRRIPSSSFSSPGLLSSLSASRENQDLALSQLLPEIRFPENYYPNSGPSHKRSEQERSPAIPRTRPIPSVKAMDPNSSSSDETVDIRLISTKQLGRSGGPDRDPSSHQAKPRQLARSTYEYVEFNSSPPRGSEAGQESSGNLDGAFFDDAGLDSMGSPVRPRTPVQVMGSWECRERSLSPQNRPKGSRLHTADLPRPNPMHNSRNRIEPGRAEHNLDCDAGADGSSDYGSPKDPGAHFLPVFSDDDKVSGGSSPYVKLPDHYPLSMAKNTKTSEEPRTANAAMNHDDQDWSSPYHGTPAYRHPLSIANDRQMVRQARTPASGYSSPYEELPRHLPLGYDPYNGSWRESDFEHRHTPRFSSKLKYILRSSPPHPDEGFGRRDECYDTPVRGRQGFRKGHRAQTVQSTKAHRPCKSRITSYKLAGDKRVFPAALDRLVDDGTDVLKAAVETTLPDSPVEEGAHEIAPREHLTGFAAHHNTMRWVDEVNKNPHFRKENQASRSHRHFSGETVVPPVQDRPRLVDDKPVKAVDYEVPAWYGVDARCSFKHGRRESVASLHQSAWPCAGAETCAARVSRLEKQNALLIASVESLQKKNDHLRLFAAGVLGLFIGGALAMAQTF